MGHAAAAVTLAAMRPPAALRATTAAVALAAAFVVGLPNAALAAPAHAAAFAQAPPTELPPRSIRHQNSPYWVWFGPRTWVSADGAYGITITSGDGRLSLDLGFSSIVCAPGQSVAESVSAYYAQQTAALRASLRGNWRRVRLDASPIAQLPEAGYGALYFRQSFRATGVANRRSVAAQVDLDYSLASGPTYCYQRSVSRSAPADGLRRSLRQLRSVQGGLAYFGPGVPGGSTPPPDL